MKFATFNLYQFAAPPNYWYEAKSNNSYSPAVWEYKKAWIKDQLRLLDADVVGFQEVFSPAELEALVKELGYDYFSVVENPVVDEEREDIFVKPIVALASKFPVKDVSTVILQDDIKTHLPLNESFGFSRKPVKAIVDTQSALGEVLVYVAHLKSKRPMMDEKEYADNLPWENRVLDTMQSLSRGHVASLLQRGAEAAILYHDISDVLKANPHQPIVVMGDLNDDENSIPLSALTMSDNIYEIGGIQQKDWPEYVVPKLYDFRIQDSFRVSPDTQNIARPYTHIYRGHGSTLDYILVSNALNQKNPDARGQIESFKVLNTHIQSDGIGNHKQSDHGQVVISLIPKGANLHGDSPDNGQPAIAHSLTRQEFIDLAGGIYQSDKSYSNWSGQDKWENFWQFFFDTNNGWVKSVYGAVPIDELYQKRRHSIEHIIPKSFLKDFLNDRPRGIKYGATTNPFNFAACERGLNSSRSNFPFDMEDDRVVRPFRLDLNPEAYATTGFDAENEWIIPSRTRGDIARSILYMTLVYEIDELYNRHLDTLIHWAKIDPPTSWELAFNRWVESKLGIRNPFIAEPGDALKLLDDLSLLTSVLVEGEPR